MLLHYFSLINAVSSVNTCAKELNDYWLDHPITQDKTTDMQYYIQLIKELGSAINDCKEINILNGIFEDSNIYTHFFFLNIAPTKKSNYRLIPMNLPSILDEDLPKITTDLQNYFNSSIDEELFNAIAPLLKKNHLHEATHDAFLILTQRLKSKYPTAKDINNDQVRIDHIFGKGNQNKIYYNGSELTDLSQRNALCNFIKGTYGLFRNSVAHEITLSKEMGTISLENINYLLISLNL